MTFPLCHLKSPFLRNLRWLISASLSISPFNSPLSTNDLYTKYINDSSVTITIYYFEKFLNPGYKLLFESPMPLDNLTQYALSSKGTPIWFSKQN
jgi:hypothetical protein